LDAWWAAPAIINSHFLGADFGAAGVLAVYGKGVFTPSSRTLVLVLPGYGREEALRIAERLQRAILGKRIDDILVEWFPERDEMSEMEASLNAGCVILDWDGSSKQHCRFGCTEVHSVLTWAAEECEQRLQRPLSKREREATRRQLAPQVEVARESFLSTGEFERAATADSDLHAEWVALRLVKPDATYSWLEAQYPGRHRDAIRRACDRFAERAWLAWPPVT